MQEGVAHRGHFDGEALDFSVVIVPGDQGGDGGDQTQKGRSKRQRDPFGQHVGFSEGGGADSCEHSHDAVNGAHQAEEGADAHDDFQNDQAAFQAGDFLAGAGFQRAGVVFAGPMAILVRQQHQPAQRGGMLLANLAHHRQVIRPAAGLQRAQHRRRDDLRPAQSHAAFNNKGQPDDRRQEQHANYDRFHDRVFLASRTG